MHFTLLSHLGNTVTLPGRDNHCPSVGGQVSYQIWSLASWDLVIWGLGSRSESEKAWGGDEVTGCLQQESVY